MRAVITVLGKDMVGIAATEETDRPAIGTLDFQSVFSRNGEGKQIVGLHLQAASIIRKSGGEQRVTNGNAVERDAVNADAGDGEGKPGFASGQPECAGKDGAGADADLLRGSDPFCA